MSREGPDPFDRSELKAAIAERIRLIRLDLYGENGAPLLAEALGLSQRVWQRLESGETMPAHVLLRFLEHTSAEPNWLYTGEGPRYRPARPLD